MTKFNSHNTGEFEGEIVREDDVSRSVRVTKPFTDRHGAEYGEGDLVVGTAKSLQEVKR